MKSKTDWKTPEQDLYAEQTKPQESPQTNSLCDSDEENVSSLVLSPHENIVVPYEVASLSAAPVITNLNISNSSDVHIGNKTIFNGPVIITRVIGGVDNKGYLETGENKEHNGYINKDVVNSTDKNEKIKFLRRNLLIGLLSSLLISFLIILPPVILVKKGTNSTPHFPQAPNSTLRYVSRLEWIAQPPSDRLDDLRLPVPSVIIAHTATNNCSEQSECVAHVRYIQTYHLESKKWFDIGYNFLVGGDGSAYVGRGWDYVGAHTKFYNIKSIGIAFLGTFNTVHPPKRQVEACIKLIEDGVALGKISKSYKLFGHRQLISTLSPGDQVYAIIKQWKHWSEDIDIL